MQKRNYDTRAEEYQFQEGDLVYVYHPMIKERQSQKRIQPWAEPFIIPKELSPENTELGSIDLPQESKSCPVYGNGLNICPEGGLELYTLLQEEASQRFEEWLFPIERITKETFTGWNILSSIMERGKPYMGA